MAIFTFHIDALLPQTPILIHSRCILNTTLCIVKSSVFIIYNVWRACIRQERRYVWNVRTMRKRREARVKATKNNQAFYSASFYCCFAVQTQFLFFSSMQIFCYYAVCFYAPFIPCRHYIVNKDWAIPDKNTSSS